MLLWCVWMSHFKDFKITKNWIDAIYKISRLHNYLRRRINAPHSEWSEKNNNISEVYSTNHSDKTSGQIQANLTKSLSWDSKMQFGSEKKEHRNIVDWDHYGMATEGNRISTSHPAKLLAGHIFCRLLSAAVVVEEHLLSIRLKVVSIFFFFFEEAKLAHPNWHRG